MANTVSVATPDEPVHVDVSMSQGATFTAEFTWLVNGVARVLTDCQARMAIARRPGVDPMATVSSEDGEIVLAPDGRRGVIRVTVPATKTAALNVKKAVYDLIVIDGETVHRVAEGVVLVRRAVTMVG